MAVSEKENGVYVGNTFFEFFAMIIKYRWFLFWIIFIGSAGATLYAVFAPKWYMSTASVFAAEKSDLLSSLSGISGLAKGLAGRSSLAALYGQNDEMDKYKGIIKSGTMTNDIVAKFKLREEYEMEDDYYDKVLKEWGSNLELEVADEGNLNITVYSRFPKKAAEMANYIVEKLNEINTALSVTNAKANRAFVEKRYLQNVDDINALEDKMKAFQEHYGVVAVPEQIEATVKSMASIYADLYKKQVEFNVLKQSYGVDHPMTKNASIEMNELDKKINGLNMGTDASQKDFQLLIPFKKAPALGNEYLKIYRGLEIQYKILEFIQPMYEQARVEENRSTPSVVVLDYAGPAERKSKPKISLYGLLGLVISTTIGLVIVLVIESFKKLRNVDVERFDTMMNTVKKDLRKVGLFRKS